MTMRFCQKFTIEIRFPPLFDLFYLVPLALGLALTPTHTIVLACARARASTHMKAGLGGRAA